MVRGIEGTPVFKDKEDREQFLHHVVNLARATETRIAAWTRLFLFFLVQLLSTAALHN
jgi:hypothetical protein